MLFKRLSAVALFLCLSGARCVAKHESPFLKTLNRAEKSFCGLELGATLLEGVGSLLLAGTLSLPALLLSAVQSGANSVAVGAAFLWVIAHEHTQVNPQEKEQYKRFLGRQRNIVLTAVFVVAACRVYKWL